MYIYMRIYIYIYTYVYVYAYVYAYVYVHIYIYIYVFYDGTKDFTAKPPETRLGAIPAKPGEGAGGCLDGLVSTKHVFSVFLGVEALGFRVSGLAFGVPHLMVIFKGYVGGVGRAAILGDAQSEQLVGGNMSHHLAPLAVLDWKRQGRPWRDREATRHHADCFGLCECMPVTVTLSVSVCVCVCVCVGGCFLFFNCWSKPVALQASGVKQGR